jgi:hypothetical protein
MPTLEDIGKKTPAIQRSSPKKKGIAQRSYHNEG